MSDHDGIDRDTPGGRPPRAWETAQRLRLSTAANDDAPVEAGLPAYAELHCLSDFSFLRGAASAEELFARAAQVGYEALAITDECSLAGIVRGLEAARITGVKLIVGSEFILDCGMKLLLLVLTPSGYTRLCELITQARRAVDGKGYRLTRVDVGRRLPDVAASLCGPFARWTAACEVDPAGTMAARRVRATRLPCGGTASRAGRRGAAVAAARPGQDPGQDARGRRRRAHGVRRRRALQDTMTAIRHNLRCRRAARICSAR